jgi:Ca2+-binding RTX toxin-like protein
MRRLLLFSLVLLVAVPATASAATVSLREDPPSKYDQGSAHLFFTAAAGERNDVALAHDGASFVVRDLGAPLTPGAGCSALGPDAARCGSALALVSADVDLRDLDDTFASALDPRVYLALLVSGGDGHDELTGAGNLQGGPGPDVLTGSAGQDTLSGGADGDLLRGLGGDDVLSGDGDGSQRGSAEPADDLLDGGDGVDVASYAGRSAGVRVDLGDRATDGQAGEHDQLLAIESVTGGRGPDELSGDAGPNRIDGDEGDDVLRGRDGDDKLVDGSGADALYGGPGGDTLTASGAADRAFGEAGNDRLTGGTGAALDGGDGDDAFGVSLGSTYTPPVCGAGRDGLALAPQKAERVGIDCEDVHFGVFDMFQIAAAPARRARSVLSLPAGCNRLAAPLTRCDGRVIVRLRRPGRKALTLGARSFDIAAQRSAFVRVQVRRAARRALAGARRPLLDVEVKVTSFGRKITGPGGVDQTPRLTGRWTVRLP